MPKFIFAYHGGKMPETEEARAAEMAAWGEWMSGLGPALVDPGNPAGPSKTVSSKGVEDNGGANPISGYSLVNADNIDAAVAMAKGCPILKTGSIEVAEAIEIQM
jgi:hypothetical protein